MKFSIVNRSESALFPYQAWPTVCKDENGVLYVTCSGHRSLFNFNQSSFSKASLSNPQTGQTKSSGTSYGGSAGGDTVIGGIYLF